MSETDTPAPPPNVPPSDDRWNAFAEYRRETIPLQLRFSNTGFMIVAICAAAVLGLIAWFMKG
jgi:hypothetical protein